MIAQVTPASGRRTALLRSSHPVNSGSIPGTAYLIPGAVGRKDWGLSKTRKA